MVYLVAGKTQTKKRKPLAEAGYSADKPLTFNLLYTPLIAQEAGDCRRRCWRKNWH